MVRAVVGSRSAVAAMTQVAGAVAQERSAAAVRVMTHAEGARASAESAVTHAGAVRVVEMDAAEKHAAVLDGSAAPATTRAVAAHGSAVHVMTHARVVRAAAAHVRTRAVVAHGSAVQVMTHA